MRFRASLDDSRRVHLFDVSCAPGTRWAEVAQHLPPGWPRQPTRYAVRSPPQGRADSRPVSLTGAEACGDPPLLQGCSLMLTPGHGPVPSAPTGRHGSAALSPAEIRVVEGPDTGWVVPLDAGSSLTIGRDPACTLALTDPALSRRHCTVRSTRGGVVIGDLSSTNGGYLDGVEVSGDTVWPPSHRLHLGGSVLEIAVAQSIPLRTRADHCGRLVVTPGTDHAPESSGLELTSPAEPQPPELRPPPLLSWVLPLVVSSALALVLRMPVFLLFGLMAPAMMLGGHVGERRQERRRHADAVAQHATATEDLDDTVRRAVREEVRLLRRRHLDVAAWAVAVRGPPAQPLWAQTGETGPMSVRLGRGRCPTTVSLDGIPVPSEEVPVLLSWTGVIGVVGPPGPARALARTILVQALLAQDPSTLQLGPVRASTTGGEWDWLAWAPHRDALAQGRTLTVEDHLEDPDGPERAAGSGHGIRLGRTRWEVGSVDHLVEIDDHSSATVHDATASGSRLFAPDLTSRAVASRLVHAVSHLRTEGPATETAGPPRTVGLRDIDPQATDLETLRLRWQRCPRTTEFALGCDGTGVVVLDLARDGPHTLVAGTTGAGKSELLRTLVTCLALGNRPDEFVFVLVDYKGGAAFADCARLPHCVGMVTDLDPHLADRALTSLGAELTRRERLLAHAGARDLESYQRLADQPTLPRLAIVIDEFRALAEELPGFVDGLVRIAALGRSLGVHLVLATQRPAGIVSADVRANVNLRIALRLRDAHDSFDVLESPEAAQLPEGVPGRALLRTGAAAPRVLQVAQVATRSGSADPGIQVQPVVDPWSRAPATTRPRHRDDDPQDSLLAQVVTTTRALAGELGIPAVDSPWLAPLPEHVRADQVGARGPTPAYAVAWGLLDLPAEQRQEPALWRPVEEGHFAVVGSPRSGATSTLRTVAAGLLGAHDAGRVHLYCFDVGTGLRVLADAPHTGAWVAADEADRGARVLRRLVEQLQSRQLALAGRGLTSFAEQQDEPDPWPLVVWCVDGWGRFAEVHGEHDRGTGLDAAQRLLKEGPAVGIVALLSGDRTLLSGRLAGSLPAVWALRLADPTDLLLAGLSAAQVPRRMPAGRVIEVREGVVAQVALPCAEPAGWAQVSALREVIAGHRDRDRRVPVSDRPWRVVELPARCQLSDLTADGHDGGSPRGELVVGVGGDAATAVGLDLDLARGGAALVAGPPRSGRSTALHTLRATARRSGLPVVWVDVDAVTDVERVRRDLTAATGGLVLVDDVESLADTAVADALLAWADALGRSGGGLVVAADVTRAGAAYRGLVPLAARRRSGILLCPQTSADGAIFGVHAPTGGAHLPGRGLLVRRGTGIPLQVALPPEGATQDVSRAAPSGSWPR